MYRYLQKKQMKALKHTFHKLQEEFTLLGMISMLLVVCEEQFVKSCIIGNPARRKLLAGGGTSSCSKTFWTFETVHQVR